MCLHTYPITILSSPQRIFAMQNRPECLITYTLFVKQKTPQTGKLIPLLSMHQLGQGMGNHSAQQGPCILSCLAILLTLKVRSRTLNLAFLVWVLIQFLGSIKGNHRSPLAVKIFLLPSASFRFPKLLNQMLINSISKQMQCFDADCLSRRKHYPFR